MYNYIYLIFKNVILDVLNVIMLKIILVQPVKQIMYLEKIIAVLHTKVIY